MSTIKVTTKTSAEIEAAFDALCKNIQPPAKSKPLTQADRLAPYRKAIMKQRRRGLTWRQIAEVMADPSINEKVTDKLLMRVFGKSTKSPVPPPPHLVLDPLTHQLIRPPASERLFLDPVTGEEITPPVEVPASPAPKAQSLPPSAPPAAPAPVTAAEHARYDDILKRLIPPIVKVAEPRPQALQYASGAVQNLPSPLKEGPRFMQIVELELNGLNESNLAFYGIDPAVFAKWKRRWDRT